MERIYEREPREPQSDPNSRRQVRRPKKRSEWMNVLLFYVLPFLIINGVLFILVSARPHITIQVADTKDYKTSSVTVTLSSLLPITEFTSAQEGAELLLTREKRNLYTGEISKNGVIEIYAKTINGMTALQYEHVNILDDVAPVINDQYTMEDGILTITFEDSQSGLDPASITAVTPSGISNAPIWSDKLTGTFSFAMGEEPLIIHASDLAGNVMQATFSTHTQVLDPDGNPLEASAAQEPLPPEAASEQSPSPETEIPAESAWEARSEEGESPTAGQLQTSIPAETQPEATTSADGQQNGEVSIYIDTTTP